MKTTAFMTASYEADFSRCRLLCESMDRFASGHAHHYVLVDHHDYALFSCLDGPGRTVVDERDLLPDWLHALRPSPLTRGRPLWWSTRTWPMRGWHVQQLRRIAMARDAPHDAVLSCDSDMVFVRPFDAARLWKNGALRLYRVANGIGRHLPREGREHRQWSSNAARLLGVAMPDFPAPDYINNLVSWSPAAVRAMCDAIEGRHHRSWCAAIGTNRTFSECQIYGAWVDGACAGAGHWHSDLPLCRTYWGGDALEGCALEVFLDGLKEGQVAVGLQSFTGTDSDQLRPVLGL